jgi:hypothetical protein
MSGIPTYTADNQTKVGQITFSEHKLEPNIGQSKDELDLHVW